MKLFETHTHTSGVSHCSQILPREMPRLLKDAGVDSFMLTNHYTHWQFETIGYTHRKSIQCYIDEYKTVKEAADEIGIPVVLGAEVTIEVDGRSADILLFGVSEDFLLEAPVLYTLSQKELYRLCSDAGIPMYQAHPFRSEFGHAPVDPEFLDGVEVNLHPYFLRSEEKVYEFADKHNLSVSCGSDVHDGAQAGSGGILTDAVLDTAEKVIEFMRANKRPKIFIR